MNGGREGVTWYLKDWVGAGVNGIRLEWVTGLGLALSVHSLSSFLSFFLFACFFTDGIMAWTGMGLAFRVSDLAHGTSDPLLFVTGVLVGCVDGRWTWRGDTRGHSSSMSLAWLAG
jgi:hypothetical protein